MKTKKIVTASLFLSLGIVLPFFTGQIKEIGDTLLPMHIPVMLCGLICGPTYGMAIGFLLPFIRSALTSMPPVYPNAVWMALEMATYGFVIGFLYFKRKNPDLKWLYFSMLSAMLSGRIVWGVAKAVLLGIRGKTFGFSAFLVGGFVDSALGILLQLILIPSIIVILKKFGRGKE